MMLAWLAVATAIVFDASSLFAASPQAVRPEQPVESPTAVQLSQQDGPHILLRLDMADMIDRRLKATRSDIRTLLMIAKIGFNGLAVSGKAVQVRITDPVQIDAAKTALTPVTAPGADGGVQEMTLDDSETGLLKFALSDVGLKHQTSITIAQCIKVIKYRLQELGVAGPVVETMDQDGILVQTSVVPDRQILGNILTRPGRMSFQLVDLSMPVRDAINGRPPVGSLVLYTQDDPPIPYLIENRVVLSDENVLNAKPNYNAQGDKPAVVFRLDSKGTARFRQVTTQNVGKPLAVILDDYVISAPVIREPIDDGFGQISGNFTVQEANNIALLLRTGSLPARLTIAEEAR
jgi:SecD/SecF fusion protein